MAKLKVVTICTAEYNSFIDNFLLTYSNIFPNVEKELYIVSDIKRQIDIPNVYQYQIQDDYYKLIQVNKLKYIVTALSQNTNLLTDDSKFIYVDVDTIFINKPMDQWYQIWDDFCKYELIFTHHPIWWQFNQDTVTQEQLINFYSTQNEKSVSVINNKKVWVILSMFGGSINALYKFYLKYCELEYQDIENNFIPTYPDEQYAAKIINDLITDMGIIYYVDIYSIIKELNAEYITKYSKIFVYQKYASDKKTKNKLPHLKFGDTIINNKQYDNG